MTRKDYRLIAASIKDSRDTIKVAYTDDYQRSIAVSAIDSLAYTLAHRFAAQNPNFNFSTFRTAAEF